MQQTMPGIIYQQPGIKPFLKLESGLSKYRSKILRLNISVLSGSNSSISDLDLHKRTR